MPIENRIVTCDACGTRLEEENFGAGWPGWSIVHGVGAMDKDKDKPLQMVNMETHLCPKHTVRLAEFITAMQGAN